MTAEARANAVKTFADVWVEVLGTDSDGRPGIGAEFLSQINSVCRRPEAVQFLAMADDEMLTDSLVEIKRRYDSYAACERMIVEAKR